jgi:thiol:disulfide interchange protein DsbD
MTEKAIPVRANRASGRQSRIKSQLLVVALLLGVGILGAVRESRIGGDVAWASSYEAGLALAQHANKPLLFSFHAPECGWCRKLDAETFTDPNVVALTRQFVCVRLDSDVDDAEVERFRVQEFPMTLFADAQGKELARVSGYIPPDRFAGVLRLVLKATATDHPTTLQESGPALAVHLPPHHL